MILKIFIIARGGILCYSKNYFEEINIDEGTISGFLTAISKFAKEIKGGEIKALIFRNFNFIYSYSIEFDLIFVIVIDINDLEEEARSKIELMKQEFIKRYRPYLENWTGNVSVFESFNEFVEKNIFIPPKILLTGENGVGKTTIMELFPGETIIELDDDLIEIIQKPINFIDLKEIKQCIIREIDLGELVNNSNFYQKLLNSVDIVLIVTNSGASNLGRTQKLVKLLKPKIHRADLYIIANFQDLKDSAFAPEKIEEMFNIKTFGFSANKKESKNKMLFILKEVLQVLILGQQKKKKLIAEEPSTTVDEVEQIGIEQPAEQIEIKVDYSDIWNQIEEAKILDKQGEHLAAAEKFSCAASEFKDLCSYVMADQDREELNALYYLCKAWESMEFAEEYDNPEKFTEAVNLFNKASEQFSDNKSKSLALGNSAFCQALELGSKFDKASETSIKAEYYPKIKMNLRNAANLYRKGGFESESDWALATSTYFDATWYIIRADEELDLDEKKKLLDIGSGMFKSAAELFGKAGYKEKEKEVLDRLDLIEKEEKIIISALNTISEPVISTSTINLLTPSITQREKIEVEKGKTDKKKKYKLVYRDLLKKYPKIQKREFRVGIAQICVSSTGDLMKEFYEEKTSGLLGLQEDKVEMLLDKVKNMIEIAHKNEVDILIFPEMAIDLNYGQFLENISNLAKSFNMFIIPGSFHNQETKQNISIVISPDGILWEQEKHIPAIIHFEGKKFEEGIKVDTLPRQTIVCNTEFGRIAIIICRDFLDMDLRVELKNFEPPIDLIFNPAYTPVTADFKAAHFDARRSIYAYCFFVNIAEYGESLIYTPEKERIERIIPPKEENIIYKDVDLFKLRSERKKWEKEKAKKRQFIQSTR
ncbi:MAG: nitrilase-related carbon-nitrogen hydrolase [Candidatus Hodarchaeota archaeon]